MQHNDMDRVKYADIKNDLRTFVNEWGFSAALEVLYELAEEKELAQPEDKTGNKMRKRYKKAKLHFAYLGQKNFLHTL